MLFSPLVHAEPRTETETGTQAAAQPWEAQLAARLARQPLSDVYAWLAARPAPSADPARYHRWLGQMALQLGNTSAAIGHYEQAVLHNPLDFASRLELSIAYAEQGNRPAARASLHALRHFLGDRPLPAAAAERLARLETQLTPGPSSYPARLMARSHGSLWLTHGIDSNANQGASDRRIQLNLWGEVPFDATLADESLAQSSPYTEGQARLQLPVIALAEKGELHLLAGGRQRRYHQLDGYHRRDIYLGGQWQADEQHRQLSLVARRQAIDGLDTQWSLNAHYRQRLGQHWLAGGGVQWLREPNGERSHLWQLGVWHDWQQWLLWLEASWQVRASRDAGDTRRLALGVESPAWRLVGGEWRLYGQASYRQDSEPYNQPFFGDPPLEERTATLGARSRWALGRRLDLVLDARRDATRASVPLFDTQRWQAEASLVWRW